MDWKQFCSKVLGITPGFTLLNSQSSLTVKRDLVNELIEIKTKSPLDATAVPLPSNKAFLRNILTDLNVTDIIKQYKSTLKICEYLWWKEQRYDILKENENDYEYIQIVAMSKKRSFLFLFQLDEDTIFIATLKLRYYNYAGIIYNDLCKALSEMDPHENSSWIPSFFASFPTESKGEPHKFPFP